MSSRLSKRLRTKNRVRLSAPGQTEGETARGEALLTNLSETGICLDDVRWSWGVPRQGGPGDFDVHIPIPDWVGVEVKVRPVRARFSGEALEIGAMIVKAPGRYRDLLDGLGRR